MYFICSAFKPGDSSVMESRGFNESRRTGRSVLTSIGSVSGGNILKNTIEANSVFFGDLESMNST